MQPLLRAAGLLGHLNAALLAAGRGLGAVAMGLMLAVILTQVVFRYAIGHALAWPEEAARFLMLWTVGLMAPTAYRRGGFVGIDMLVRLLPRVPATLLALLLLVLTLALLVTGLRLGWAEVTGFGARMATVSLWMPLAWDLSAWAKVPRSAMTASLLTGVVLLTAVNIELILRTLAVLGGAGDRLAPIPDAVTPGVE